MAVGAGAGCEEATACKGRRSVRLPAAGQGRDAWPTEGQCHELPAAPPACCRGALSKPTGWAVWAGLGVLLSPFLVYFTSLAVESLGYDGVSPRGSCRLW